MQQTDKWQFNLVELNDEIPASLAAINENFDKIDKNMGTGSGGVESETDPTVPEHVKNITQEDIDKWNSGGGGDYYTKEEIDQMLGEYETSMLDLIEGGGV